MWNAEENKVVDLNKHRWLENTPREVADFQQKFAGEILDVVELANDPRFNWVPFKDAVATILGWGKFDPAKLADNISTIRDGQNQEEIKYNKAA